MCCGNCLKSLSDTTGDIFYSCCPPYYDTIEEAKDAAEVEPTGCGLNGEELAEYMGTFEL